MKKLLFLVLFATISWAASAQFAYESSAIRIRGSRVFMVGEQLPLEAATACFTNLNGVDRSGDYLKYRKGYKTGLGLTIGGAALASVGSVTLLGSFIAALSIGLSASFAGEEVPQWIDVALVSSAAAVAGGTAAFVAGIPTMCVYKNRLNKLEKAYNGIGIAFSF